MNKMASLNIILKIKRLFLFNTISVKQLIHVQASSLNHDIINCIFEKKIQIVTLIETDNCINDLFYRCDR